MKMKKILAMVLAAMLLVAVSVAGTVAYLTAVTDEVTNTFTAAGIEIKLDEAPVDANGQKTDGTRGKANEYRMIPGNVYDKDPTVTVVGGEDNVDVYLFVKFEELNDAATYLTYTSTLNTDNGWTLVPGETDVWYREVEASADDQSWVLLNPAKITVKNTVSEGNMAQAVLASLKYDAWAVQSDNLTVEEAWAQVK